MPTSYPRPGDLHALIEKVLNLYSGVSRHILLTTDLDPQVPPVNLDPDHMKRALVTLVDNAVAADGGAGGRHRLPDRPGAWWDGSSGGGSPGGDPHDHGISRPAGGGTGGVRQAVPREEILVVDDEPNILKVIEDILTDEGDRGRPAHRGEEAVAEVKRSSPDLVILDIWLPGMDGMQALDVLKGMVPETPVLMITRSGDE